MHRYFLILLNPNQVDEVAWLWPRSMYKTQIRAALSSVSRAIGLSLVILHQGFALGEPETRCGGWSATNGANDGLSAWLNMMLVWSEPDPTWSEP